MVALKMLNFFDLTALGVGSSLSIAIFVLIGELTRHVVGPAILASILVASVAAALAGLCLVEFAIFFFKVDSLYCYCYSYHKESFAFLVGWILILQYCTGTASVVKGILSFTDALTENSITSFLQELIPINFEYTSRYFDLIAVIVVAALVVLLACGMKYSTNVNNVFAVFSVILWFFIIIRGSLAADTKNWYLNEFGEESMGNYAPYGFMGVIKGAGISLYGFIGFEQIYISGNEASKCQKNYLFATLAVLVTTAAAYTGIGAILTLMVSYTQHDVFAALPFAFEQQGLYISKWIIVVGAVFGFLSNLFGTILSLPRVIYAMANDGLLFRFLSSHNKKLKTPVFAISSGCFLTGFAAGIFTFHQLVNLAVVGTLSVYTVLAIDVLLLRYKNDDGIQEAKEIFCFNKGSTSRTLTQTCFNLKSKIPSTYAKYIVTVNIISFCVFSTGFCLIFTLFTKNLFSLEMATILPTVLCLTVMLLNLMCIWRLPKSQQILPFQTPLVPLIPCLSIFLNILLMTSFDSSTWIRFLIWILLGILPHLIWYTLKHCRGQTGQNSFYEISKLNQLKLNESVWRIRTQKKSFLEGKLNPVFCDDLLVKIRDEPQIVSKKTAAPLQLKQAQIIHTDDVVEENTESLDKISILKVGTMEFDDGMKMSPEVGTVQWECVAEIHTKEEFPQESIVLEIVDTTYNFLREVSEEPSQNEMLSTTESEEKTEEAVAKKTGNFEEKFLGVNTKVYYELEMKIKERNERRKIKAKEKNANVEAKPLTPTEEKKIQHEEAQTADEIYISQVKEPMSEREKNNDEFNGLSTTDVKAIEDRRGSKNMRRGNSKKEKKIKEDDQSKIKEFKEKLNQLLKSQIKFDGTFTKNLTLNGGVKYKPESVAEKKRENEDIMYKSVKTLNKSQMKDKLNILLAKGPPKTPSFKSAFRPKDVSNDNHLGNKDLNVESQSSNLRSGEHVTVTLNGVSE